MANERKPDATHAVLPSTGGSASPQVRRLLEAGVTGFAERGYHGVSVRDLAGAVGIQAGSFYSHFRSKEELLYELISRGHRSHQAAVRDALLSAGTEAADQLRAAIRANVSFHGTYPLLTIVANSELHALTDEHRNLVLELRHATGVLVAAVIERGNDTGVFHCDQPWLAMAAIAGMGVRVAWWFRPKEDGNDTPLSSYPSEAAHWFPSGAHTLDEIADAYANYALMIVSHAS
jgi:AcrR family transcriptional regulator